MRRKIPSSLLPDRKPNIMTDSRSSPEPLSVRKAESKDVELVREILLEAEHWLRAMSEPLWRDDELSTDAISSDVEAGSYYVAECDGVAAGTLRFQLSDEETWPDVPDGESAFVHRLAVRRSHAGGEVSSALLRWAANRTAALGLPKLRLDCVASRPKLRALYERFGFRYHSTRQVGPDLVARYELPLIPVDLDD